MYKGCNELLVEQQDKVLLIKFNNPKRKNCVNVHVYDAIGRTLRQVAQDDSVTIVVFVGVGEFFSAGNDLTQMSGTMDVEKFRAMNAAIFDDMIRAFIDCPKVLVALVNGPAIGIGTTLAGLCDLCWCSETAYFSTPFTKLGIVPEASSSYLLPLIVGRSKATEMLLLSEKITAEEAYHFNFVSKIFKLSEMDSVIWPKIKAFSELPPKAMAMTKKLISMHEKDSLNSALQAESDALAERFVSEEFFTALMEFVTRKNKNTSKM